jgi:hypothetical protein
MSPHIYQLLMRQKLDELRRRASDPRVRARASSLRPGTPPDATS